MAADPRAMSAFATIPAADLEPWRSKQFIAHHYGVTVRTVERWLFAGCPSRLIGGVRRLLLSHVDAWLTTNLNQED